jgi:hypothetical protein
MAIPWTAYYKKLMNPKRNRTYDPGLATASFGAPTELQKAEARAREESLPQWSLPCFFDKKKGSHFKMKCDPNFYKKLGNDLLSQ